MKLNYRRLWGNSRTTVRDEFQQHQFAGVGLDGANCVQFGEGDVDPKVLSAAQTREENAHVATRNTAGNVVIAVAKQSSQF